MFGNLLNMAAAVIPQQTVIWTKFKSRTQDDRGRWVNEYFDPEPISGSFQAVDARTAKELGFDTEKTYAVLYTSHDVSSVGRGDAPDLFEYAGHRYETVGETDWLNQDGWKSVYLVLVS